MLRLPLYMSTIHTVSVVFGTVNIVSRVTLRTTVRYATPQTEHRNNILRFIDCTTHLIIYKNKTTYRANIASF